MPYNGDPSGGTFHGERPEPETEACKNEPQQPDITIEPFAIGQYEVTVKEWNKCVRSPVNGEKCEEKASENQTNEESANHERQLE